MFTISDKGIALIKEFEGVRLKAYPDPGTGGAPWTVGIGHTGPEVKPGMVITEAQAYNYLRSDLSKFEKTVNTLVTAKITQPMFDALVSFAYNCGPANLKSSTLLKKVNAGKFDEAVLEFAKWNKAAGRVLNGLTRRRKAEADLFRSGI